VGIKKDNFPSKNEFYKNILKLKREKEIKKEGEYLGYLNEQRMRKKARKLKQGSDNSIKLY